jgi:hypothetical protein
MSTSSDPLTEKNAQPTTYGETNVNTKSEEHSLTEEELFPGTSFTVAEMQRLSQEVMIMIPHLTGEGLSGGLFRAAHRWGAVLARTGDLQVPNAGFLEVTRSKMVRDFLDFAHDNPEVKYLVMVDSDEEIPWTAPFQLARHGLPIVSGVVCSFSEQRGVFACFMDYDENGVARFPTVGQTKSLPARGVKKIYRAGTGLMCIRKDVLETIIDKGENPFQIFPDVMEESCRQGNVLKTEDICFCERALKHGFLTYVDFSVHALHRKSINVSWPERAVDPELSAEDWKPSKFDYGGVK